ncbi:YbaK/prolyl-tRNA synthetase associated domain-containing protein [Geobacter sp. SVR]|uniref:YbaK/prolyl-tRNA synthetase associated domain-containing protein n=1 Tax=Geobacter sp. SVR TaxID=2495594 RepID=UPI001567A08D
MFEELTKLLRQENAKFRVIQHPAEGSSAKVAEIRGTLPGQGAKAMLCRAKGVPGIFVLAVLSGDRKVDFRKVGEVVGGKKASLVSPEEATALTGCVMGAVPPFSFWPDVRLIVDPKLLESYEEIAFNAGRLDTSIVLNSRDYLCIAKPLLADIAVQEDEN